MRPISFSIPLVIYPFDVVVSIGQTDDQMQKLLINKGVRGDYHLANYTGGDLSGGRYAIWYCDSIALIRLPGIPYTPVQHSSLNHEILHVVISVLRAIGMGVDKGSGADEAYTYLMSYISEVIYTKINKYYHK